MYLPCMGAVRSVYQINEKAPSKNLVYVAYYYHIL